MTISYEGQPQGKKCYNCWEYGHIGRECLKPQKTTTNIVIPVVKMDVLHEHVNRGTVLYGVI